MKIFLHILHKDNKQKFKYDNIILTGWYGGGW